MPRVAQQRPHSPNIVPGVEGDVELADAPRLEGSVQRVEERWGPLGDPPSRRTPLHRDAEPAHAQRAMERGEVDLGGVRPWQLVERRAERVHLAQREDTEERGGALRGCAGVQVD